MDDKNQYSPGLSIIKFLAMYLGIYQEHKLLKVQPTDVPTRGPTIEDAVRDQPINMKYVSPTRDQRPEIPTRTFRDRYQK